LFFQVHVSPRQTELATLCLGRAYTNFAVTPEPRLSANARTALPNCSDSGRLAFSQLDSFNV